MIPQIHCLMVAGLALFLIGLLNGFVVPRLKNPRMGLSAHLAAVQEGMMLLLLGLLAPMIKLSAAVFTASIWLSIYGMYAIWVALLLAAIWGCGRSVPIAGAGFSGTASQESIVTLLLATGAVAIVLATGAFLYGLV